MPYVHCGAARVAYSDDGREGARPVLLIPGLGGSKLMWSPILPYLGAYRVLIMEPRGSGDSDAAPGPYSAALLADDARQLLDHAGIERAAVLGLSMGGMITQALAASVPERVACAGLICTYAQPDEWARRCLSLRLQLLDALGMKTQFQLAALTTTSPATMARHPYAFAKAPSPRDEDLPDPTGYRHQLELCLNHDGSDLLADICCPTVVISAADDLLTTSAQGRRLADQLPNAAFVEISEAAHGLIWERPVELGAALQTFLSRHYPPKQP